MPHFKAHHPTLPSPSLPVSHPLTSNLDICANPLLISRNVGLNVLLIFIPLAWVSHFHEWSHRLTFGCMSYTFAVPLCVHKFSFHSVSFLLSLLYIFSICYICTIHFH